MSEWLAGIKSFCSSRRRGERTQFFSKFKKRLDARDRRSCLSPKAVDKAMDFLSLFMNVAGGLSVSSVIEMLASLVLTVRVVTVPIIMR